MDDFLEALLSTVVGVGYAAVLVFPFGGEPFAHAVNFGLFFRTFGEAKDVTFVLFILRDDEVELGKIAGLELAGAVTMVAVAEFAEGGSHASIGHAADVVAGSAARVEFYGDSCFFSKLAADDFCSRRAADVAEADKEDARGGHDWGLKWKRVISEVVPKRQGMAQKPVPWLT